MHNCNLRATAVTTALLLLFTAASVFASKVQDSDTSTNTSKQELSTDNLYSSNTNNQELTTVLTLELNDGNAPVIPIPIKESASVSTPIEKGLKAACDIAKSFIGTPYRWGGTTPKAFDCSGFTRYVYSQLGVKIPRTARQQYKAGQVVNSGQLEPGDLVFFDIMKGYVSHVGMYLGAKQFIHASTPKKGVRVDRLDTAYYKKYFVGARRYDT